MISLRWKAFVAAGLLAGAGGCANVHANQVVPAPEPVGNAYGDYLAGRAAASDHDMAEAARLFRNSLAADPNNPDILSRTLLFTAGSGDVTGAAGFAQRVIATAPDDRIARLTLAVAAIKQHDFADARQQIRLSGKGPFTTLTLSLLDSWSAQGEGNTDAALAALKDLTGEGGTAALQSYHRALILDLAGRNDAADAAYREVLSAAASPRMVEAYGRFLERTRPQAAQAFYAKYTSDGAIAPIVAAGDARLAAGTVPDRMVPNAEAGAAEALFGIAASLSDDASADVAILYLRLALYLAPDLDLAKVILADREEALKKYQAAIVAYQSIAPSSPFRFAADVQIAIEMSRLGDNDKAITELQRLTAARPNEITAWTALGDVYRSTEKYAQAVDAYDHAIKLLPTLVAKDWPLLYARGVSEERSHRWAEAERDLQQALKLSPQQPQVLNYLGYSWVDQGRNLPQAVAMLEKARSLSPYDGYITDSVGWAYFRLGRYQDAAKTLEQAVMLAPGDPTINEHLGDAYWMIGRKLDAHFQWDHALAFGADDKQKAEIEKKLQSGLRPAMAKSG